MNRRIALVCMTPASDTNEHGDLELPSYGVRRILAAVLAAPELKGVQAALIDVQRPDVDAYVNAILSVEPDLIGFSIYVWSMPCLVEVARRVRRARPKCGIVFGGPSARTAAFDLYPYAGAHTYLDAVVATEGEAAFREIARLPEFSPAALEKISGLDLPHPDGWRHTGRREPIAHLDQIPSPYQLGVMSKDAVAYLETYRGCPFSCSFCEWGASENPKAAFSTEYIMRELESFQRHRSRAVFLVDAGLNLNVPAFRNLKEAADRTGLLRSVQFWSEIYPSHVREEHLEFLASVQASYLGIGLQSIDPVVLKGLDRPFDVRRFENVVRQVCSVANAELQIIFGLPGDTPEGFRRTLEYARSLPASVRAYHCLVLPDALMTRAKPEWNIEYDPVSLRMTSCSTWSEEQLTGIHEWITDEVAKAGGKNGDFWWFFPKQA
jgi:radical SAM superfamily enzyme YgiQ (UPF0313 family)